MSESDTTSDRRLELTSAVLLSVASVAASWAGYQSGLWDGDQASKYIRANALRIEASKVALEGDALASLEAGLFRAWLDAKAREDEALARFYEARFPLSMKPAFNAWLQEQPLKNPAAVPTPFHTPIYDRPGRRTSSDLDRQAQAFFEEGERDNATSDAFEQSSTILAGAMFFAGIGQVFKLQVARIGLLTVAAVTLVFGLLRLLSLPMQVLGFGPSA